MKKKRLPMLITTISLVALTLIISSFSKEKDEIQENKYWYTSNDVKGYISILKKDYARPEGGESTIIHTEVNAQFENKPISFNLSTTCKGNKMVEAKILQFNGLMDVSIKPVNFVGKVLKEEKKGSSIWNFQGDFLERMSKDPEAQKFIDAEFNAVIRMPERTIPFFNLWAIVPNLPFDRKGTFKFNTLDETKLYVKKNHTINYLGKFNTEMNGKDVMLHKFVHQGKKMKSTYYWVNDEKVLVKIKLDDKFTFVLSTKEKALKNEY